MKKIIHGTMFLVLVGFALTGCKKEILLPSSTSESIGGSNALKVMPKDFHKHPFTYLQNKYLDTVLTYELKKDGVEYDSEKFSFQEKLDMITLIDSMKTEKQAIESSVDIQFYQDLETELMNEINSHSYLQEFINSFALIEDYDERDMLFNTGSYNYYGSTFDFNSIMLYGSNQGQKNINVATMLKKDGTFFYAPTTISPIDKNVIRQIYN